MNRALTTEARDLISGLKPNRDLARLVERALESHLPWLVVSSAAVAAWGHEDQAGRVKTDTGGHLEGF